MPRSLMLPTRTERISTADLDSSLPGRRAVRDAVPIGKVRELVQVTSDILCMSVDIARLAEEASTRRTAVAAALADIDAVRGGLSGGLARCPSCAQSLSDAAVEALAESMENEHHAAQVDLRYFEARLRQLAAMSPEFFDAWHRRGSLLHELFGEESAALLGSPVPGFDFTRLVDEDSPDRPDERPIDAIAEEVDALFGADY